MTSASQNSTSYKVMSIRESSAKIGIAELLALWAGNVNQTWCYGCGFCLHVMRSGVYMYMYTVHTHTHIHTFICTHNTHPHTCTHTLTHAHTHSHTHAHTHTHIHTRTHTHTLTHMHTHAHTHSHTHAHTHTHIHTHTHTHAHTCTHCRGGWWRLGGWDDHRVQHHAVPLSTQHHREVSLEDLLLPFI